MYVLAPGFVLLARPLNLKLIISLETLGSHASKNPKNPLKASAISTSRTSETPSARPVEYLYLQS